MDEPARVAHCPVMGLLLTLVHSPLVGPATWELVAGQLRDQGWEVAVPDLRSTLADGPPYASRQIAAVADSVDGRSTVLIGHSGAGPLLGPATHALDDVRGCVFVDAGLPAPGESSLQNMPPAVAEQVRCMAVDGWLPPWTAWWDEDTLRGLIPDGALRARIAGDCPPLPLAMLEEPSPPARWLETPSAYLRLSEAYQHPADRARRLRWPVVELRSHHLALVAQPSQVIEPLFDLVAGLGG